MRLFGVWTSWCSDDAACTSRLRQGAGSSLWQIYLHPTKGGQQTIGGRILDLLNHHRHSWFDLRVLGT